MSNKLINYDQNNNMKKEEHFKIVKDVELKWQQTFK